MSVVARGTRRIAPFDRALRQKLQLKQTAIVADGTEFPVWQETAAGVLLPRYSPLCADLTGVVDEEERDFGPPDSYLRWDPGQALREEQRPGAAAALAVLRAKRGCLIRGDTGSGKTVVGLRMLYELQPRSTLVLVDQRDIARQWGERIRKFMPSTRIEFLVPETERRALHKAVGPPIGEPSTGAVLIGTAQSLRVSSRFLPERPLKIGALICDEVHVFGAPSFVEALFRVNYRYAVGLTATDDRRDGLDWVFRQFVGFDVVAFAGRVMEPEVVALRAPDCGLRADDWYMTFCRLKRGMTWKDACTYCPSFDAFPHDCGGGLSFRADGDVKWGDRLNRAGLIAAWCASAEYRDWLEAAVVKLAEQGRKMFVFADAREFLIHMYERLKARYGDARVGVFLGKGRKEDEPRLDAQRDSALTKQITFATYGVARKALDVPEKDTAVLAGPISDARQVVGRVRRFLPDKRRPLVVVPVATGIRPFFYAWRRIRTQFRSAAWSVSETL